MTDDDLRLRAHGLGTEGPGTDGPGVGVLRAAARLDEGLNRLGLRSARSRDCLLAVVVALVSNAMLWSVAAFLAHEEGIGSAPAATAALIALLCAQSLVLCVRRRNPVLCLVAVVVAQVGVVALVPAHVTLQGLAPFIAAYTCGALLPTRRLVPLLAAVVAAHGVLGALAAGTLVGVFPGAEALSSGRPSSAEGFLVLVGALLVSGLLLYAGSAFVGAYAATRRRYAELVRERAAEAVQRQRERAEGAVRAERARMARELHDIAAHHLSGMVVQAGAAERLIGRDDRAAREATAWVRSQGRETLDSLRLVVGALRDPGEEGVRSGEALSHGGDPGSRGAPVPGAAALGRLVRAERELGRPIDLVREGEPYDLPPVADVTVYRVAREALSNAREHAPGAPVRVLLRYRDARVVLQVDSGTGAGTAASGGPAGPAGGGAGKPAGVRRGLGLLGMRERAQLVGADLEAGPTSEGGWRVRLDLPVAREVPAARAGAAGTAEGTGAEGEGGVR